MFLELDEISLCLGVLVLLAGRLGDDGCCLARASGVSERFHATRKEHKSTEKTPGSPGVAVNHGQ